MKILVVCVLGCAMMVLVGAAALDEKAQNNQIESSDLVKRHLPCHGGWSQINGRCFYYVPRCMTWVQAEKNCQSLGANLASVHNMMEYQEIQRLIATATHDYKETWIGGSDAQQENTWLWSDGSTFHYSNWCPGEPNNSHGRQNCLKMNHGVQKCWDDYQCYSRHPSVCAKRA